MICCLPRANMKKTFSVVVALVVSLICLSVAKAGDVSVKVRMTTGPQDPPTTTFASNTPKLYAIFKTEGAKTGDKIRGVLIAEDVGDEANECARGADRCPRTARATIATRETIAAVE